MPQTVLTDKSGRPLLQVSDDGRFLLTGDGLRLFGEPPAAAGRQVGATGAIAQLAVFQVGGEDGSFVVEGNLLVTTVGTINANVTVGYTDEAGNVRSLLVVMQLVAGSTVTNATTAAPHHFTQATFRAKAGTTITVATTGTFTGSPVYNAEARIRQVA